MRRTQMLFLAFVAAFFGILGGVAASWLSPAQSAIAQTVPDRITAREFRLVDERNVTRAWLFTFGRGTESGTTLLLNDHRGENRLMFTVAEDGTPNVHLWHKGADGTYRPTSFPSISLWGPGQRRLETRLPGSQAPSFPVGARISPLPDQGGKADDARSQDVRHLQRQLDQLWVRVDTIIERINAVSG